MIQLEKAIKVANGGGIVIFPTDTAFGIGCRIDKPDSVKKLFRVCKRPEGKAMPVLFESTNQVKDYLLPIDSKVEAMMGKYWPGALTIVYKCDIEKVSSVVRGGGSTLGVRIPDHRLTLDLIDGAGVPLVTTSANFAGEATPFSLKGLDKELIKLVDFVLEGKTQGRNKSSTVVDCTKSPWEVIRQGDVTPDL